MSTPVPDPLCPVCQAALQTTWAACPHCGTPISWRDALPVPRPIAVPLAPAATLPPQYPQQPPPQIVYVQAPPPPKRRSLWPLIGGLLLVLCGLGAVGNLLNPARPNTTSSTDQPQMTVAEQTYVNAVTAQSTELGPLFTQLSTEMKATDFLSAAWTIRIGAAVAGVQLVCEKARKLSAPVSLSVVDTPYQSAITHYTQSMDLLTKGISDKLRFSDACQGSAE